ncbi:MAG: hypothetical protein ABSD73_04235 [Candidatus Bathyarchaeia archaeon]|jgi:hypothetical protein
MRVIVDFNEDKKPINTIAKRTEKLEKFFVSNDIEVYGIPPMDVFGHERLLVNDVDKEEFEKIYTYIVKKLKAKPSCIHLPYQTLCVNGNGDIETIDEEEQHLMQINEFVQSKNNKQLELPKILVIDQNQFVRLRWHGNLLSFKCVRCHDHAEYINSGLSLCKTHFLESLKKQKEPTNKETSEIVKKMDETKKEMEKANKNLEELTGSQKSQPLEKFKKLYE